MSVQLVFLLEEPSMKEFLEELLPRVLPEVPVTLIPHDGKSDLEASMRRKLRAWRAPDARFIVVRDQDSADCRVVKDRLVDIACEAGRPDTVVRIACRELEAWILGDLQAVAEAFGAPAIASRSNEAKFRDPDALGNPVEELKRLVPSYQKRSGARSVGRLLDPERSTSPSFMSFLRAVRRLADVAHQPA